MADRGIIFSAPMVRALLAGRKTQTRRVIKLPTKAGGLPIYEHPKMGGWAPTTSGGGGCFTISRDGQRVPAPERLAIWHQTCGSCLEIRYQPGDRLWVRESCCTHELETGQDGVRFAADDGFVLIHNNPEAASKWVDLNHYGATIPDGVLGRRVPSIHMPRWASRLTLEVTDIRVQRLQDISEEDAIAEGMQEPSLRGLGGELAQASWSESGVFKRFWDHLHGPDAWTANPWVAALTFTTVHANIDAPLVAREFADA